LFSFVLADVASSIRASGSFVWHISQIHELHKSLTRTGTGHMVGVLENLKRRWPLKFRSTHVWFLSDSV
jgi:hypothetical protein